VNGWQPVEKGPAILDAPAALGGPAPRGRVAIVGATMIGAEAAWYCALAGAEVTLIERRPDFADDVNLIYRLELAARLAEAGVRVRFSTEALAVGAGGLVLRSQGGEELLAADAVVAAFGAQAAPPPAHRRGAAAFQVGECAGQFGIMAATHGGDRLGRRL
jgi:NADPH-dependent 2,4-dienoyl-CoA reductase/sulfur reductase-like enzyme